MLVLSSSRKPRATFSASPRSICAPAEPAAPKAMPAELQLGGSLPHALLDQVHGEGLGFLIVVVLHHLETVDNGADRTDQVVAYARAQKRGEIQGLDFGGDDGGHE